MAENDADKFCSYVFSAGERRPGERCEAYHIQSSPYCLAHSEDKQRSTEGIARRKREMDAHREDLLSSAHSLQTRKEVQTLTEKVINGILRGYIKKDQAAALGVFLPFSYKIAKELEPLGKNRGVSVNITQTNTTMALQMTEEQMDQYLAANEHVRVEILEQMDEQGSITMEKQADQKVSLVPQKINPEKIKVDTKTLVEISEKTDIPITQKQALRLFGPNLKDAPPAMLAGPDQTGFGDVFEIGQRNKPMGLPDGALHKWKGKNVPDYASTPPVLRLWFTCENCGKVKPNIDVELCPTGGKFQRPDPVHGLPNPLQQHEADGLGSAPESD